ncbi:hypothetical protein GCM10010082_05170 [Kushneria pakistanensis]|uniref:Uncharacterized protein n=1 Tax=Kushneria pakistanensis TaxID=1508770 RepID=A0ABQ3FBH2_9GAMM|nr:hypothetical protein GCM10010082_05170 [Kushneria pakistanensis]
MRKGEQYQHPGVRPVTQRHQVLRKGKGTANACDGRFWLTLGQSKPCDRLTLYQFTLDGGSGRVVSS